MMLHTHEQRAGDKGNSEGRTPLLSVCKSITLKVSSVNVRQISLCSVSLMTIVCDSEMQQRRGVTFFYIFKFSFPHRSYPLGNVLIFRHVGFDVTVNTWTANFISNQTLIYAYTHTCTYIYTHVHRYT